MPAPSHHSPAWPVRLAGIAAGACFLVALCGFGAALAGYAALVHPVAVLGAIGVPRAGAFNAFAFVVPGLLAAFVALGRRGGLRGAPALAARLGWTLALLAALAFLAQGLLPLELDEPDAGSGRWHGVAWGVWVIASCAAALCLSLAALRGRRPWAAAGHAAAGTLVFALAWGGAGTLPAALVQRAAFACWFAWLACVAWPAVPAKR